MAQKTIETIRDLVEKVDKSLQSFSPTRYKKEFFGEEGEYDAQSLKREIREAIRSLNWLAKVAHAKFLRVSTYGERSTIIKALERMNDFLNQRKFHHTVSELNALKRLVRQYDVKGEGLDRKQLMEEKIVEFDEAASKMEGQIARISAIAERIESHEEDVETFGEILREGEKQLDGQKQSTSDYIEKIAQYKEEQKQMLEEARGLIEEAKSALEYTTARGISAAYQEKYKAARHWRYKAGWIGGSIAFVLLAFSAGLGVADAVYAWLEKGTGGDPEMSTFDFFLEQLMSDSSLSAIINRLTLVPIMLAGAWFCAGQYVKNKNLAEDYSYKAVLAQSMMAFVDKMEDANVNLFIQLLLNQMLQDPLRKTHAEVDFLKEAKGMMGSRQGQNSNDDVTPK